jgi:hypothetical protein
MFPGGYDVIVGGIPKLDSFLYITSLDRKNLQKAAAWFSWRGRRLQPKNNIDASSVGCTSSHKIRRHLHSS